MAVSLKTLGLDALSIEERLQLAEELWQSVAAAESEVPASQEQREDLDRRLDAFVDDPQAGEPWEIVRDRLRPRS